MKKIFTFAAAATLAAAANAQALTSHKFLDNWSIGVNVGAVSPVKPFSWSNLYERARLTFGAELTKQWSPVFATGIEGSAYVNTTVSPTAIDQVSAIIFGKVNLMNLFGGYKGAPRFFEIQTRAGVSYNYNYNGFAKTPGSTTANGTGTDFFGAKFGLDFDFNLGESKAWTLSVKPAITYNLDGQHHPGNVYTRTGQYLDNHAHPAGARVDVHDARFELTAGLTYHFKNSNGAHHFLNVRPYDQAEIDGLNGQINSLRGQLNDKDADINNVNARIADLERQLQDARNRKPSMTSSNVSSAECYVFFKKAKSNITRDQQPNVERIAVFLRNHPEVKVDIKGYASPEGRADFNQKLSERRANAVKDMLIRTYKIAANRITVSGEGVGHIFDEPTWNRVTIGTIDTPKK